MATKYAHAHHRTSCVQNRIKQYQILHVMRVYYFLGIITAGFLSSQQESVGGITQPFTLIFISELLTSLFQLLSFHVSLASVDDTPGVEGVS